MCDTLITADYKDNSPNCMVVKVLPDSLPSVWLGADHGVQAAGDFFCHPAVGCHYFPPGMQSPSQLKNITVP